MVERSVGTKAERLPAAMLPRANDAAFRVSSSGASKEVMTVFRRDAWVEDRSIKRPISPRQSRARTEPPGPPELASCCANVETIFDACEGSAFEQHDATACESADREWRLSAEEPPALDDGRLRRRVVSSSNPHPGSFAATSCPRN